MQKKKVLLVDDDRDIVDAIAFVLKQAGYDVEVAYDGQQGLEKVAANKPNIIVLDVMMPVLNGYETCKKLKASQETRDIPVIMLTAVASMVTSTQFSHRDMMESDAEDYMPKPVDPKLLMERIEKLTLAET